MRASRLLRILMLLQTRGRISARSLADELEVSIRSIYRDMDHLSEAGVPVMVQRGASGGFELLNGWRTRLTGLTPREGQALFLSGLPGPMAQLGMGDAMAAAQLKLLAALPAEWQVEARRISARFHLDPIGWYRRAAPAGRISEIAEAAWSDRRLLIRYDSWKGDVRRRVDPLGLVLKAGDWYLVGDADGKPRTYRVASILEVKVLPETFRRAPGFELAAYWEESVRRFEQGLYRATAEVHASVKGLKRLRGLSAAVATAVDAATPANRGWTRLKIPIESIEDGAAQLLALSTEVEVIAPRVLRRRMGRIARRLAARYA
jgi:predicted DNA-binding transcriptional regulator YafY